MTRFFIFLLILSAFSVTSTAQSYSLTKISNRDNSQFFPLSELKEGLKGTARTVFRGSVAEEFNVEILGVVPSAIGPGKDLIVGKLSGGGADRTAVFAGMSGSPVYIDGKLVGAISYSFPFSKEAICGITPIEQMIEIFEQKSPVKTAAKEPRAFSFGELAATTWKPDFPNGSIIQSSILAGGNPNSALGAAVGQTFQPIATPMAFSGISQETLNQFAPQLMSVGLVPVASAGGGSKITPLAKFDENTLRGGSSVSMSLVRGDYSMAAAGTVTYRDGDKIYAFGHPFLNLGTSDLPMSESHVVVVVPNLNNSFKLAVPDAMVGTMSQDRSTGVFGKLGQAPKTIPVRLNIETSRGQTETVNFEVVKDDFLTPLLLNISIYNAILANERSVGEATIEVNGEIKLKNNESIKIDRRFSGTQAALLSAGSVAIPTNALLKSRFDEMEISQITLNLSAKDGSKTATLERAAVDKSEVRAGETFEVQAYVRSEAGKVFIQKIPVKVPADTPAGTLLINVADGATAQQVAASQYFVPKDLSELVKTINGLKKDDRLYVQTYRVTNGAVIGSKELPNLPPSVLATLSNERTVGAYKPTIMTVWTEQEVPPADFTITGQQVLTIEVVK